MGMFEKERERERIFPTDFFGGVTWYYLVQIYDEEV
jgi:hypothetical protein